MNINEIINGNTVIPQNETEFMDDIKEIEQNTTYVEVPLNNTYFKGNSKVQNILVSDDNDCTGISLYIDNDKKYDCRPYAIKTACDRLGISGSVLNRFNNGKLAGVLNLCKDEYPTEKVLMVKMGKNLCLAMLSDGYKILSAKEVFYQTKNEVCKLGGSYYSGYINADIFSATYSIKNQKLEDIYKGQFEELENSTPMITVETSNTGLSSVSIVPKFKIKNREIVIGKPLRTLHKGKSDISTVEENLNQIYPMFKEAIDGLSRLKKIKIENPIYCLTNVAKRVLLPKKYVLMAAEDFENFVGVDDKITAYDIYFALSEVLFYAENDNRPKNILNNLQEQVARALYIDFAKYDVPYSDWK